MEIVNLPFGHVGQRAAQCRRVQWALTQLECRVRVDVVVREKAIVLKLRAIKNQRLTGCGDAVLGFYLGFHMCNGVRGVDFESSTQILDA